MFPHLKLFIISEQPNKISSKQQKTSNMTTEKKDLNQLTDIDHSFTFNSKVSNIADDYLFTSEDTKRKKAAVAYIKTGTTS